MPDKNQIKATDKEIYDNVTAGDFYHSSWAAGEMFEFEKKLLTRRIRDNRACDNGIVLEIGCGGGHLTTWLSNFGSMNLGLDHSIKFIKEAALRNNDKENCAFLLGDGEVLPLNSNSVDLIMCGAILHHLPNYKASLRELYRCLKDDGIVAAIEPCAYNPFAVIRRKYFPSVFHTPDERPFPPNEIIQEFKKIFDIVYYHRSFIFSINAPLVEKYLGNRTASAYLAISMLIDRLLVQIPLIKNLCWRVELVGIKKSNK